MTWQTWLEPGARFGLIVVIHATVLAALTWAMCRTVLRRCRPGVHAFLWTVVLVKFLLPPILPGEVSLSGTLAAWASRPSAGPASEFLLIAEDDSIATAMTSAYAAPMAVGVATGDVKPADGPGWAWILLIGYAIGLTVSTLWYVYRGWCLLVYVRSLPQAGAVWRERVARLARRMGRVGTLRLRITQDRVSPFLVGVFRPTLVLSSPVLSALDERARDALILHELAHVRRGDLVVRALQNVIRVLLFFWPPAWWVCRQIERFAEIACDQAAVLVSRIDADAYAASLLTVVKTMSGRRPSRGMALAFAREGRVLEERFKMILERKHRASRLACVMIPALAGWTLFALTGGALSNAKEPPVTDQPKTDRQVDDDHPLPKERQSFLLQRFGKQGIDANEDGVLTRGEVIGFFKTHGLPPAGRKPGDRPGPGFGRGPGGPGGPGPMMGRDVPPAAMIFDQLMRIDSGAVRTERILGANPEADADKDGELSEQEYAEAIAPIRERLLKRLVQIAPRTDKDEDGELSEQEVAEFKAMALERAGKRIFGMDAEADKDGDGKLSESEYLAFRESQAQKRKQMILENHPDADKDGDGALSEEELRTFERTRRGNGPRPGMGPGQGFRGRGRGPLPGERTDRKPGAGRGQGHPPHPRPHDGGGR